MFYITDFKTSKNKIFVNTESENTFSVIISNSKSKKKFSKYSIVFAAKPLIRFAALFGSQLIRYEKNNVVKVKLLSKLYSLIVLTLFILSIVIIKPVSWHDTKTDVPLNILTKTFGMVNFAETVYSVFSIAFFKTEYYVDLFNKLNDIDNEFCATKVVFRRRRLISYFLIMLPIVQMFCTFWLRKFFIQNIGAHISFFLIMLQGSILIFFVLSIYIKCSILNILLLKRVNTTITKQKEIIFQDNIFDVIIKRIYMESNAIKDDVINCCWFELMQLYDKLADCIHLFNKIYCGQVFIMFNSWLLCTLLIICRSLSPSLKYTELFLSDLFLYSCLNSRPLFLASMCEMFIRERKRTLLLLLHILLSPGKDEAYFSQVQTMLMLVSSRQLEISANVFTVNVSTVMNFAGRIISYTVLMIQYFYSHVFPK